MILWNIVDQYFFKQIGIFCEKMIFFYKKYVIVFNLHYYCLLKKLLNTIYQ